MMYQTDHNRNHTTLKYSNGNKKPAHDSGSPPHRKLSWDRISYPIEMNLFRGSCVTFAVAILCFCNSAHGDFVFDDSEAIVNNNDLRPETPLWNIFANDFWGTKLTTSTSHKSYRPLTVLTFRLNYWLSGGLHACSFHAVNILLHAVVSVLVFLVLNSIFSSAVGNSHSSQAPLLSALLFAVHPIHTESVAGVVGRADLLCATFFLLAFLAYRQACLEDGKWTVCPSTFSYHWILASLALAGISMLSKEQGITVIGLCSAYDIILQCRVDISECLSIIRNKDEIFGKQLNKWQRSLLLRHLMLLSGGIVLLLVRWQVMGSTPPSFQPVDNPSSFEDSFIVRAVNYNYIYSLNIWLLLNPWSLCFDWSMGCIPLIKSFSDWRLLYVFVFWTAIAMLLYSCIYNENRKIRRLTTISLAMLIIPFLPASNLFFRVGFVIAERVLYLPSIGFCCLTVVGLYQLSSISCLQQVVQILFFVLILLFSQRAICRSAEWNNEEILFRSGLRVCPLNAKVHYNIAKNAADHGQTSLAIQEYKEAIRLNTQYDQAMNNLANILKDQGQLVEAEKLLQQAIVIRPDFAAAWMNLGIVQAGLGKMAEAEKSYHVAIQHRRRYPDCYYNLGNLYLEQKRYEEAYKAWRNATSLRPTQLVAWNNMIVMLDSTGELERAERVAEEALHIMPNEATLHFNLANTLGKRSKYRDSELHFLKAIRLNSNNPMYFTNLGVLYHLWGKFDKAEEAYHEALKIKPEMKRAHENLDLLKKARLKQQGAVTT